MNKTRLKQIFLPITCWLVLQTCFADTTVYEYRDAQGNMTFSDTPHGDAQTINVPNVQSFSTPPVVEKRRLNTPPPNPMVNVNYKITILSPTNEETIWDNQGNILVQTDIYPALSEGAKLQIVVDGTPKITVALSQGQLQGIDQGQHTIITQVVDAKGNILVTSAPVTVYLHHASLNAPLRRNPNG
jgi:hypothetical protein